MKLHPVCIALACTLLLAGCAAGQGSASSAVSAASPAPAAAEPTAAPEPTATSTPTPDPSSLLDYTALPLDTACWADFLYIPNQPKAADYARQFVWGLYNRDVDSVRAACSPRALDGNFPLDDLDGLCITSFGLSGGEFDSPSLTITVADPGATPLLRGMHSYYLGYASEGKVDWISLYGPGAALDYKLRIARFDQRIAANFLQPGENCTFTATATGDAADALGLIPAAPQLECYGTYWFQNDSGNDEYETRDQQTLGTIEAPPYGITRYGVPPDGNVLTDNKLEVVCKALNAHFAALTDGSYHDEVHPTPGNMAQLSAWDAAVPLPVSVTPEALRSRIAENTGASPCTDIWVPLPKSCWAVFTIKSNFAGAEAIKFKDLPYYCQSLPAAVAAVLPQ